MTWEVEMEWFTYSFHCLWSMPSLGFQLRVQSCIHSWVFNLVLKVQAERSFAKRDSYCRWTWVRMPFQEWRVHKLEWIEKPLIRGVSGQNKALWNPKHRKDTAKNDGHKRVNQDTRFPVLSSLCTRVNIYTDIHMHVHFYRNVKMSEKKKMAFGISSSFITAF